MLHAVHTHHSFDRKRLFHCNISLFGGFRRDFLFIPQKAGEPQGVEHHEQRRKAHRRRRVHRIERNARPREAPRRQRNADDVIEKRPEQILLDDAHGAARQGERTGRGGKIAAHEHDVRALDRHVRAVAHGNADVRLFERGGIVDAVADHRNPLSRLPVELRALRLVLLHVGQLIFGEHFRVYHVRGDARALRNIPRARGVVAREHVRRHAEFSERGNRLFAPRFERIGKRERCKNLLFIRKEEHRFPLCGEPPELRFARVRKQPALRHHAVVAQKVGLAVHLAARALPDDVLHALRFAARAAVLHNALRKRMVELALHGGGNAPDFRLVAVRLEKYDARLSLRDGRRLVEQDGIHVGGALQGFRALDEHPEARAPPRCRHDRDGRCKPQRARAGNHDDAHAEIERRRHVPRGKQPCKKGDQRNGEHRRNEDRRNLIGKFLNGRFARARLAHHADNGREHGIFPHFFRFDFQIPARHERRAHGAASLGEFDGQALARDRRLIDKGVPLDHNAVHGDGFALSDDERIARRHVRKRDLFLFSLPLDGDGIGRKAAEFFDLPPRAAFALIFQPFAQRNERDDHRRRLEKERRLFGRQDRHDEAVHEGDRRAQRDERIHIRHELDRRAHAAHEKLPVDEENEQRQPHLKTVIQPAVRHGNAHHMPHGKVHFGNEQNEGKHKAHAERELLFLLFGNRAEVVCAVSERGNRAFNARVGDDALVEGDFHALAHERDGASLHPFEFGDGALDARRARRARHSRDGIFFLHIHLPSVS